MSAAPLPRTRHERVDRLIEQHAERVLAGPVHIEKNSPPPKPTPATKADLKRELLEIARSLGWRGKAVHSAQKFVQALERAEHARRRRPDPAPPLPSSPGAPS